MVIAIITAIFQLKKKLVKAELIALKLVVSASQMGTLSVFLCHL